MGIAEPRKRDGQLRRRELCDAAIDVMAEQGSRGLSHQRVDRRAEVPDGTTSYYYRTRAALLHGVAERIAEIDTENLQSVIDASDPAGSPFARLAALVIVQADGPGLQLNKARHELLLASTRDAELAAVQQKFGTHIRALTRDAVGHLGTSGSDDDPELVAAQGAAISTFISGMFTRFVVGSAEITTADELELLLRAIVTAVSEVHQHARH
ncbi:MAG: TetR/AcrR family transcriptional regulator [Mycobacterium sp.]